MKNNNNLFFVCSLIEYIARKTKNRRSDIVIQLGNDIQQIYEYEIGRASCRERVCQYG